MARRHRNIEIRLPTFWFRRVMFETASHKGSCTTEEIKKKVKQLQVEYAQEPTDYLKKHLKTVAVLVDGVVTQAPVKDIRIKIDLDLSKLETEKSLKVRFGSKLHELLYQASSSSGLRWREVMHNKQVAQLQGAGYLSMGVRLTNNGEALLAKFLGEGPRGNGEERKLCRCLLESIGPPPSMEVCKLRVVHDHLFEQEYMEFVTGGGIAITRKGIALLEKHADHLITLKSFEIYKRTLVSFLSKDKLPEYLVSPDPKIRKRAELRYNTIEEGG